jgi:hypothetical protein
VAPVPAASTPSAGRGTITVDEVLDIEELADLARQVEKRTR